eukprot:scaffold15786_cov73-Phaeocystis_antarctica.AAC.2
MSCGLSTGSSAAATISGTGRGRSRLIGEATSADARSKTSNSRLELAPLRSSTAHQQSARSSRGGRRKRTTAVSRTVTYVCVSCPTLEHHVQARAEERRNIQECLNTNISRFRESFLPTKARRGYPP